MLLPFSHPLVPSPTNHHPLCCNVQTSMSGIEISEDAVNLFYHMRSKSAVRSVRVYGALQPASSCSQAQRGSPLVPLYSADSVMGMCCGSLQLPLTISMCAPPHLPCLPTRSTGGRCGRLTARGRRW